jgi:DNA-binding transcriptional MerR regulator
MTKKILTRAEAAEYIGVCHQTITNWEKSGLLTSIQKGQYRYYWRHQIDSIFQELTEFKVKQESIDAISMELDATYNKLQEEMKSLRSSIPASALSKLGTITTSIMRSLSKAQSSFSEEEVLIVELALDGEKTNDIANALNIKPSKIATSFNNVVKKLQLTADLARELVEEKEYYQLKSEDVLYTSKFSALAQMKHIIGEEKLSLLETLIPRQWLVNCDTFKGWKYNAPHRLNNGMLFERGELAWEPIVTIGDLVAYSKSELKQRPHMTYTMLKQIEDFVEKNNLTFSDKMYIAYKELRKHLEK